MLNSKQISRTVLGGLIVAAVAIGLFLLLWSALSGLDSFVRLFLSVCIPPAVMAAIVGIFFIATRARADSDSASSESDQG